MNGKEFKAWAADLPDKCTVEMEVKYDGWHPLDPQKIRAIMSPPVETNVLQETE